MSANDVLDLHATNGADRVREHTAAQVQRDLDRDLVDRICHHVAQARTPREEKRSAHESPSSSRRATSNARSRRTRR